MKLKQKLIYAALGFLIGNIVLVFAFVGYNRLNNPSSIAEEVSFEKGLKFIKDKEISGVHIYEERIKLSTKDGRELEIKNVNSDAMKESILNEANSSSIAEVKLHSSSSGWHWLFLLNLVPIIFVIAIIGLLFGIFYRLGKNNSMK